MEPFAHQVREYRETAARDGERVFPDWERTYSRRLTRLGRLIGARNVLGLGDLRRGLQIDLARTGTPPRVIASLSGKARQGEPVTYTCREDLKLGTLTRELKRIRALGGNDQEMRNGTEAGRRTTAATTRGTCDRKGAGGLDGPARAGRSPEEGTGTDEPPRLTTRAQTGRRPPEPAGGAARRAPRTRG